MRGNIRRLIAQFGNPDINFQSAKKDRTNKSEQRRRPSAAELYTQRPLRHPSLRNYLCSASCHAPRSRSLAVNFVLHCFKVGSFFTANLSNEKLFVSKLLCNAYCYVAAGVDGERRSRPDPTRRAAASVGEEQFRVQRASR